MQLYRKTAIVQFELFSGATEGSLPLACERDFGVILTIEGVTYPAENFRSPINDEQWRLFYAGLRECNKQRDQTGYRSAASIRSLAHQLYTSLVDLSPALRDFMEMYAIRHVIPKPSEPPQLLASVERALSD